MLIMYLFLSYAHVNLCHFISSFWFRGLAASSACGSSGTFLFTFFIIQCFLNDSIPVLLSFYVLSIPII